MTREDFSFLPRPPELSRSCFLSFQPQFLWEALGDQEAHCLTTHNSLSLLGGPVRSSGRQFIHNARANAKLPAIPGLDPPATGTLSIQGQSIPYHRRGLRTQDTGWLRGQTARMAAVTQPCTKPTRLQAGGQRLPGTGNKAEGCEYALPSFGSKWLPHGGSSQ